MQLITKKIFSNSQSLVLLLLLISLALYIHVLNYPFIWDDTDQIVNNILLHSASSLPQLLTSSTFNIGGESLTGVFFRPVVSLVYFISYQLFELRPAGYHLIQIIFHSINTILVYFVLKKILSILNQTSDATSNQISFFSALFFSIHPTNIESVVYIGSVGEVTYVFFSLLSFIFIFRAIGTKNSDSLYSIVIASVLLLCSLLTKESAIVTFIIAGYLLFAVRTSISRKQLAFFILAFACVIGGYLLLRFGIAHIPIAQHYTTTIGQASLLQRFMTIPYIILHYIVVLALPVHLVIYDNTLVTSVFDYHFWGFFIFLFAVLYWAKHYICRSSLKKTLLFFSLWFFIGLTPVLNIYAIDMTTADRWLYLPQIGFWGFIFTVLFSEKFLILKKNTVLLSILILGIVLCVRNVVRAKNWSSPLRLFSHDLALNPKSFELLNNTALEFMSQNKTDIALLLLKRSAQINPNWYISRSNLAVAYDQLRMPVEAEKEYKYVISHYDVPYANANLIALYIDQNRLDEAQKMLDEALVKYPSIQRFHFLKIVIQYQRGEKKEALTELKDFLTRDITDRDISDLQYYLDNYFLKPASPGINSALGE